MKQLRPGESTGYGRTSWRERDTWIGIVPVGYADGFRRDLTGTEVRVAGERRPRRRDDLDGRLRRRARPRAPVGTPVTIIGHGMLAEEHARVAGTITYELVSRIASGPTRARRTVV